MDLTPEPIGPKDMALLQRVGGRLRRLVVRVHCPAAPNAPAAKTDSTGGAEEVITAPVPPSPLRLARQRAGWRLTDLVAKVGVSRSAIWRLETGKRRPRPRTLHQLSEVLGVKGADLFANGEKHQ